MNTGHVIEVIILAVLGVAAWNVFFTSSQTPGVIGAVGSNSNSILKTLTAH